MSLFAIRCPWRIVVVSARLMMIVGFCLTVGCAVTTSDSRTPTASHNSDATIKVLPPEPIVTKLEPFVIKASAESTTTQANRHPFEGATELSEDDLVREVLNRNPSVAQMAAAVEVAASRYPQVTSLEDPRFGAFAGPASINRQNVDFAYRLEISQAIPFPGKLSLRGESARHEARAAGADLNDTRLTLTEAARNAFADHFLVARAIEVNDESVKLLQEFRENASTRYRTGQGEQQDVYQAEVSIARQKERASTLIRMQRVARARINTLLNQPPDQDIPPPPKELKRLPALPTAAKLREEAVNQRPDLAAIRARLSADEAAIALTLREYYPDFEAMAGYDAFWQRPEQDLRPIVGVRLNLPVRLSRRDAAVAEAQARLTQRRAELARLTAQIGFQVQEAYEQVAETQRSLKLYEATALPAARENVRLARASYATGKVPFISLIEAQRNLVELRDRHFELLTEARRRRALLDRAIGAGLHSAEPPVASPAMPQVK